MRFLNYIQEDKMLDKTMIGYKVNLANIKPLQTSILDFCKHYKLSNFKTSFEPHISIAYITNNNDKSELIRTMHQLPKNFWFNPKELNVFLGKDKKTSYIVLELNKNKEFTEANKEIKDKFETSEFPGGMKPHISIGNIQNIDDNLKNKFLSLKLILPKVKVESIDLYNDKQIQEFSFK